MCKYLGIIILILWGRVWAQSNSFIEIRHADKFTFDNAQSDAKLLIGAVAFEHDGAILYCDTALFYEHDESIKARGHIRIIKGDSISAYAKGMVYSGKDRMARLIGDVHLQEKRMHLQTDTLDFNLKTAIAYYIHSARSTYLDNTFISKIGFYNSKQKKLVFLNAVELKNPTYTIRTDTLNYLLSTSMAYFLSPTIMEQQNDFMYGKRGWYNTKTHNSKILMHPLVQSKSRVLRCDSLYYDGIKKIAEAFGHIVITDTINKVCIKGNRGFLNNQANTCKVYQNPRVRVFRNADTLYIKADTLMGYFKSKDYQLKAWLNVQLWHDKFQGRCDTLLYNTADSTMHARGKPIFWYKTMQIHAKDMQLTVYGNHIYRGQLTGGATALESVDSSDLFKLNQIQGKTMMLNFTADTLCKIRVMGQARSLHWMKDQDVWSGIEQVHSDKYNVWFKHGDAIRITAQPKTQGKHIPIKECSADKILFNDAVWKGSLRPQGNSGF